MEEQHNDQAERAVLCSLILEPDRLAEVSDVIGVEEFYSSVHQNIFKAIKSLYSKGTKVDLVTVSEELTSMGKIKEVTASYLAHVAMEEVSASHIMEHANIIKEKKLRREVSNLTASVTEQLEKGQEDVEAVMKATVSGFSKLLRRKVKQDGHIKGILSEVLLDWERVAKEGWGIPAGIPGIDKLIKGYRRGHYWVVVAYTSMGKTSFATMLVEKLISSAPKTCIVFFSAEMTYKEIVSKVIAQSCGEDMYTLAENYESEQVITTFERLAETNLFAFDDCITTEDMSLRLNMLRMRGYHPEVVFVDYIQNLKGQGDNYTKLTNITGDLQRIAIDHDLTVVALSQTPDDSAKGEGLVIKTKGSGDIAATAGFVMRLKRDKELELQAPENNPHTAIVDVLKNRYGQLGSFDLYFDTNTGLFSTDNRIRKPKLDSQKVAAIQEQQNIY